MKTTNYTPQEGTLSANIHPNIRTQKNIQAILIGILLCIVSLGTITGSFLLQESSPTLSLLMLTISAIFICYAMFLFFSRSSRKVYIPTGSEVKERTLFFDLKEKYALQSILGSGDFYISMFPLTTTSNGSVRLDVQYSTDGKFAAAQLFVYEPYTYHPLSPIHYYEKEQAAELRKYIEKMR